MKLREYQRRVETESIHSLIEGKATLFVMPCGGGKTPILASIAEKIGRKAYLISHRKNLMRQSATAIAIKTGHRPAIHTTDRILRRLIDKEMDKIGIPKAQSDKYNIISVQSVARNPDIIPKSSLIELDEAHHCGAKTWNNVFSMAKEKDCMVLGCTATPMRMDGTGLDNFFDVMVKGEQISALQAMGWLSKARLFAPTLPDFEKISVRMGEFVMSEARRAIISDPVQEWERYAGEGKATIAFCCDITHAEITNKKFTDAGYKSLVLHSNMPLPAQYGALDALRYGEIDILVSVDMISEGSDIPHLDCILQLRPNLSRPRQIQEVGRVLRFHEGKAHGIIVDLAGNYFRHGLPEADIEWTLEGRKKRPKRTDRIEGADKIHACKSCGLVFDVSIGHCPMCQTKYVPQANVRPVQQVEGEITEWTGLNPPIPQEQEDKTERKKTAWRQAYEAVGEGKGIDTLKRIAREAGYKEGWAFHAMKTIKKKNSHAQK